MSKFEELLDYLSGKDVTIIGNAQSGLNSLNDVDSHEVVIRLNKGFPRGKELALGGRTDVLCLSLALTQAEIEENYGNPKFIVWCTPKHELMNDYLKKVAILYPQEAWDYLYKELLARPSTGCMAVAMASNALGVTLYGFDFWKSPNWYTNTIHIAKHCPTAEKQLISEIVADGWGEIK